MQGFFGKGERITQQRQTVDTDNHRQLRQDRNIPRTRVQRHVRHRENLLPGRILEKRDLRSMQRTPVRRPLNRQRTHQIVRPARTDVRVTVHERTRFQKDARKPRQKPHANETDAHMNATNASRHPANETQMARRRTVPVHVSRNAM